MLSVTRSAISSSAAASTSPMPSCCDALAQDRQAGGEVGGADVGDEAGLEALAQALLEGADVAREAVGGEHELAPASCSALKVWKNSSSVLALLWRNWTSSTSSTSTPR